MNEHKKIISTSMSSKKLIESISPIQSFLSLNNLQINELVDKVINGFPIKSIDYLSLPSLIRALHQYFNDCIIKRIPNEAEIVEKLIREARDRYKSFQKESARLNYITSIEIRLNEAENLLEERKKTISEKRIQLKEEFKIQEENLIIKQKVELEELKNEWSSEKKTRHFNFASNNLRDLRTKYILLFNAHRNDELKSIEKTIDQLSKKESDLKSRSYYFSFFNAENRLIEKHKEQLNYLKFNHQSKLENFETSNFESLKDIINRIDKLKNQLINFKDPDKIWGLINKKDYKCGKVPRKKEKKIPQVLPNLTLNLPPLNKKNLLNSTRRKLK